MNSSLSLDRDFAIRRIMIAIDDGEMSVLRFGEKDAPPLLFGHANGFCASAYRQMFEALGGRFDIFGVDLRGFGATMLPADPDRHRSMNVFAKDIRALVPALAKRFGTTQKWVLAGHSLGGVTMMLAAEGRDDVAALKLIEPAAMPRSWTLLTKTPIWPMIARKMPLVRAARGRRASWPDRDSVLLSYSKKPFFSTFANGALEDYLADGLRDEADKVVLSCSPQWEAATFAGHAHDFWGAAANAPAPVSVMAAVHPTTTVPPSSLRGLEKRGARVVAVNGVSHLIPFEKPALAAEFLAET